MPAGIGRQLSQIDIARGRQEALARQHPAALEGLKQAALIQSVEASNAIENAFISTIGSARAPAMGYLPRIVDDEIRDLLQRGWRNRR